MELKTFRFMRKKGGQIPSLFLLKVKPVKGVPQNLIQKSFEGGGHYELPNSSYSWGTEHIVELLLLSF